MENEKWRCDNCFPIIRQPRNCQWKVLSWTDLSGLHDRMNFTANCAGSADQVPGVEWHIALNSISFWLALLPNVLTGGKKKKFRSWSEASHVNTKRTSRRRTRGLAGASCCLTENFVLIIYEREARAITFRRPSRYASIYEWALQKAA